MELLSPAQQALVDLFQKHVQAELDGDLETTMATMTDAPHLNHVPTMMGGVGREGVQAFYRDHLVGKFFPPDVSMVTVSRTVGTSQIVEELVISFTHTTEIDWMLPGVRPTGRRVEAAFAPWWWASRTARCLTNTSIGIRRACSYGSVCSISRACR